MSKSKMTVEPVVLVHGGAAPIIPDRITGKMSGVKYAATEGHQVLLSGGSALDAVEEAVRCMENDSYFNAGFGSVLNENGEVAMDASIMDGIDLSAGAVAMVRDVANPICLARCVLEHTPHVLLAGSGTSLFAKAQSMITVPPNSLISDYSRKLLEIFKSEGRSSQTSELGGTVGAVAIDDMGNVAAATSTGGTNGKMLGRIGDTPQIGSGTYADNNAGAVSSTGNGEMIIRYCLAHTIIKEMESGKSANDATTNSVALMSQRLHSTAGAISLDKNGNVGIGFSSSMMPWAYKKGEELHFGLNPDENFSEII